MLVWPVIPPIRDWWGRHSNSYRMTLFPGTASLAPLAPSLIEEMVEKAQYDRLNACKTKASPFNKVEEKA